MFGGYCVEFRHSRTVFVQVNWMESIGKIGSVFYIIIHGMETVPRNKRLRVLMSYHSKSPAVRNPVIWHALGQA